MKGKQADAAVHQRLEGPQDVIVEDGDGAHFVDAHAEEVPRKSCRGEVMKNQLRYPPIGLDRESYDCLANSRRKIFKGFRDSVSSGFQQSSRLLAEQESSLMVRGNVPPEDERHEEHGVGAESAQQRRPVEDFDRDVGSDGMTDQVHMDIGQEELVLLLEALDGMLHVIQMVKYLIL